MEELRQVPQQDAEPKPAPHTDFEPEILAYCCEH